MAKAKAKPAGKTPDKKTKNAAPARQTPAAAGTKKVAAPAAAKAPKAAASPKPASEKKSAKPAAGGKAPKTKAFEAPDDADDIVDLEGAGGGDEEIDLAEFEEAEEVEVPDTDTDDDDDSDDDDVEAVSASSDDDEDVILTDAEGNRYCRVRDCDQISTVDGYCRFHYLLLWKKIQVRKKILTDGKLEFYIVELTSRYPDKFLEMIRKDLRNQKDFLSAIQELEIDEGSLDNDFEEEDTQFIDEVRGLNTATPEGESVDDDF